MTDELKPCPTPWCARKGGEPYVFERRRDILGVYCPTCSVSTPYFRTEEAARECWNTRSTSLSDEALAERVAIAIHDAAYDFPKWDGDSDEMKDGFRKMARAAIEAIASSDTTLITALREALEQLLAEARERGGGLSNGEVLGCAALRKARALSNQPGERG